MKNIQTKNVMRKKKLHPIADQFSDDEMQQIKRYGQALGGSPTSFDEEVERCLRVHEANYAKVRVGQTDGSNTGAGAQRNGRVAGKQRGAIQRVRQALAQAQGTSQNTTSTPQPPLNERLRAKGELPDENEQ
jgi:hypothetical protein